MLLFAPRQTLTLGQRIARCLGVELAASEEREHDGGEHKMRPTVDVYGRDVFVIQSLHGEAQVSANDKLCRLLFFIGALRDAGAARVTACVPYLCYARKDRRTHAQDPTTLRYVATMFEAVGVDRLVVLDVHNEAAFDNAFRCPTLRLDADALFLEQLTSRIELRQLVVASPDIGGVKRAQRLQAALAKRLGVQVDFAFMEKRRVGAELSGETLVGEVAGRDVLIYDDIIASGATVKRAAAAAKHAGALSITVAATHAAFTDATSQLFAPDGPARVLVSDSIQLPESLRADPPKALEVISIAELFAAAIRRLAR